MYLTSVIQLQKEVTAIKLKQVAFLFYFQITTLINHKDNTKKSDKTLQAIQRVGQAVNLAVGRFVKVGEAIANENWDLKEEITIACIEAKQAGMWMLISKCVDTNCIALDTMTNCLILSKDVRCELAQ